MRVMIMKNPIILAICIFIFSSVAVHGPESILVPNLCCYKFSSRLPKNKVVDFQYTDKLCPLEGVLFRMKRGVVLCADPSMPWVKAIIDAKEKELAGKLAVTKGIDQAKEIAPTKEVNQAEEMAPTKEVDQAEGLTPTKEVDQAEGLTPTKEVDQAEGLTPTKEVDQAKGLTPAKEINQEIYVQYCFRSI
ncbi:lymphotactin-like [Mugil cephalus]|uniref:lymphotactin-like n=1 Tax=Mugil cephalus TaxID=48193 RepID=UPI001FB5CD35|nr:lymphotactin-like [Mugil cephalus]